MRYLAPVALIALYPATVYARGWWIDRWQNRLNEGDE